MIKKGRKSRKLATPGSMRQRCWDIAQPTTKKKKDTWSKNKAVRFKSRLKEFQGRQSQEMEKPFYKREEVSA